MEDPACGNHISPVLWKLGRERGPSHNNYYCYRKSYFGNVDLCGQALMSELNVRARRDG